MTNDPRLTLAAELGVLPSFYDLTGTRRDTSVETAAALLAGMGVGAATEAEAWDALGQIRDDLPEDVVCETGRRPEIGLADDQDWELTFEDGTRLEGRGPHGLPELPLGVHRLESHGRRYTLLAAPASLPAPPRCWGLIGPLYGLSERGIGSYADLADLAAGMGRLGASFLGVNPVHAGFPVEPDLFSPYTPSHRRRLNVLHLPTSGGEIGPLVDYARDIPVRMAALRDDYAAFNGDPAFDDWRRAEGDSLARFALHQALSERHGAYWSHWPAALHAPSGVDAATVAELKPRIRFHAWLQWRAEQALSRAQAAARQAGMRYGLYLDLAVGTHPHGAETWEDPDSFASGISLGAPPDPLGPDGQNWGLAPFNPRALRARAYAPFAETLRRHLRFAGALRIDHVLGFERAFWVPDGGAAGAYMRMPRAALLAVTRIEAARAGAVIVGEDLGVLPDGLQGALAQSGVLGCRLAMFERESWHPPRFRPPEHYDANAIASFSTHDLPTWRGWRKGMDIAARADISGKNDDQRAAEYAVRNEEVQALDWLLPDASEDSLHAFLARSSSALVGVQAEIVLEMESQPNLPGTVTEFPNWRLRLPVDAAAFAADGRAGRVAEIMRDHGR